MDRPRKKHENGNYQGSFLGNQNQQKPQFRPSRSRGQVSLLIGVMMFSFITFFAFVVNTGMLVSAKINLQNAADLAAFSGASVQARQLDTISLINYEMRRQYKRFLYRYYVLGNLSQKSFPRPGAGVGTLWSPDGSKPLGVPSVCLIYDQTDNFCQIAVLQAIPIPPSNPLNSINEVLRANLLRFEQIRTNNCAQIGKLNRKALALWLYNTDPDLAYFDAAGADENAKKQLKILKGLARGLGLVPAELILSSRAQTMAEYINLKPYDAIGENLAKVMRAAGSSGEMPKAEFERPVNAFYSAYRTLGEYNFDPSSIKVTELLPKSADSAVLVQLRDVGVKFDAWATVFCGQGNGVSCADLNITSPTNPDSLFGCVAALSNISVGANSSTGLPVGVVKDPNIRTYYAVKVTARANLLFSPFGPVELKAYAAAQPFGSKLGPKDNNQSYWTSDMTPSGADIASFSTGSVVGKIPNLAVNDHTPPGGGGWNNKSLLSQLYLAMNPSSTATNGNVGNALGADQITRGIQAAMAPNEFEPKFYNVLNDFEDPIYSYLGGGGTTPAHVWAPVFTSSVSSAKNKLKTRLVEIFDSSGASSGTDNFVDALTYGLGTYLDKLANGGGEGGSGYKVALLPNPFRYHPPAPEAGSKVDVIPNFHLDASSAAQVNRSWAGSLDANIRKNGRLGYSVKFVAISSLFGDATTIGNPIPADGETKQDLKSIKH